MRLRTLAATVVMMGISGLALAQGANGDYRVHAALRTRANAPWGADQSVGGADFRVHSRYLAMYYGGVLRQDNFTFSVQIDFRTFSGFATQFASSQFNTDFDVYINNDFVGRVPMSTTATGLAELTYQSRHPTPPELPVPEGWPSPISPGSSVMVYAAAPLLPQIGDPAPAGAPILAASTLEERYARGDANEDGHVDIDDYNILAASFDPANLVGPHIGPAAGDFSGDNRSDMTDYDILAANWDDHDDVPAAPQACIGTPTGPVSQPSCRGGSVAFSVTPAGVGPFTYVWRKDGSPNSLLSNPSARTATLRLTNVQASSVGSYECIVSTSCGSVTSTAAALSMCAADFNCDQQADFFDYLDFAQSFGNDEASADFNADGTIDFFDYLDFVAAFAAGC